MVCTVQENIDGSVPFELLTALVEQNKWILQLESENSSFISLFLKKVLNAWTRFVFERKRERILENEVSITHPLLHIKFYLDVYILMVILN